MRHSMRFLASFSAAALLAVGCSSPSKVDSTETTSRTSKPSWSDDSHDEPVMLEDVTHGTEHSGGGEHVAVEVDPAVTQPGPTPPSTYTPPPSTYAGGASMSVRQMGDRMVASRAFPTGDPSSSAVMVEKSAPAEVMVGQPYTYEIRVRNLTNHALEEVVVTDLVSDTYSMNQANPTPVAQDGALLTWALGDLGPGETKTIEVNGTATSAGSVQYCSEVSYEDRLCLETAVVSPSLRVEKRGPATALVCDTIAYEIDVTNDGTGTARNVRVMDSLPDGVTTMDGSRQVNQTVGDLRSGETRTVSIMAKASRTGTFNNSATAEADGGLTSSSNTVTTTVSQPVLDIVMTCDDRRFGGQNATYNVAVSNNGDAACESTVIDATIPAGTTFVSASSGGTSGGSKVTWMAGSIGPGETVNVEFTVRGDTLGPKTSNASASCVCADPVNTSCTTDIEGIPAVLLEVIDVDDPIPVNGEVTYVITVTNQGSLPGTNIRIECDLESQMEYVSSTGGSSSGGTVTFPPLPSLAPKDTHSWQVTIRATAAGDVRFGVKMRTDFLDSQSGRPVEETEATHFYN